MKRILGLLAVMALVIFALPAAAQQQDQSTQKQGYSSDQAQPTTPADQSVPSQQPEGSQQAGQAGQVPSQNETGVTQPTSESATREANPSETTNTTEQTGAASTNATGGAMPTTASPLPLVLSLGILLMAIGAVFRFASGRR